MKGKRDSGIPKFQSLEEERKYWEARGPLAEGHKGRINRPRQKRSSFLAVRLTGEELTRLRDVAAKQGLGPSTFARLTLTKAIEHPDKSLRVITLDELISRLESSLSLKKDIEGFWKDIAIGDPDNPALLIFSGERKNWEHFTSLLLLRLLELFGIQVVIPEKESYQEFKKAVIETNAQTPD